MLNLNNNQLTQLPEGIAVLTQLTYLNLDFNQLTELPEGIANLTQLTALGLFSNPLPQELLAAHEEGLDSLRAYLKAQSKSKIKLNEVSSSS